MNGTECPHFERLEEGTELSDLISLPVFGVGKEPGTGLSIAGICASTKERVAIADDCRKNCCMQPSYTNCTRFEHAEDRVGRFTRKVREESEWERFNSAASAVMGGPISRSGPVFYFLFLIQGVQNFFLRRKFKARNRASKTSSGSGRE